MQTEIKSNPRYPITERAQRMQLFASRRIKESAVHILPQPFNVLGIAAN